MKPPENKVRRHKGYTDLRCTRKKDWQDLVTNEIWGIEEDQKSKDKF